MLALGLRLWGINFGLPFLYHPDEGALIMPALNILRTGDYRPIRLDYGSAYIYSLTILYIPLFLYGAWRGNLTTVADLPVFADYHQVGAYSFPSAFLVARVLTAVLGALTVLTVYSLGKRLRGQWAGLLAATLLAIAPLHISNSHFATTDVPMTFVLTLAVMRILDVYDYGDWKDYLWAGILVGLCASTKLIGGVAFGALVIAHILRARSWAELVNDRLVIGIVATIAGFLLGTQYALDLPYFLNWLVLDFSFYGSAAGEQGVIAGDPSWLYYLKELLLGSNGPLTLAGSIGLLWLIRQHGRRGLVTIAFPALYAVVIAVQTSHFPRFLVPFVPFFALGAGIVLDIGTDYLTSRLSAGKIRTSLAAAILIVLTEISPITVAIRQNMLLAGPDVRTLAFNWYTANISPEAKVAVDLTGPSLKGWSRNIYLSWNLAEHPPTWYVDQKFAHVIISEPRLIDPNVTLETRAAYDQLMNHFTLLKTFEGSMLGIEGMRIWVYQVTP